MKPVGFKRLKVYSIHDSVLACSRQKAEVLCVLKLHSLIGCVRMSHLLYHIFYSLFLSHSDQLIVGAF